MKNIFVFFILALVVTLVYLNSFGNEFLHYDDMSTIVNNEVLTSLRSSLSTRKIDAIVQSITIQIFGVNKAAFHFVSMFLHTINAFLVFLIAKNVFNKKIGLVSGLLFAIHPANSEAVLWLSGSVYLYSALFNLLTIYFYTKYKKEDKNMFFIFSILTYSFYVFSMKTAWVIVTPFLLLVFELFILQKHKTKKTFRKLLLFFIPFVFYLLLVLPGDIEERSASLGQTVIGTTDVPKLIKIGRNINHSYSLFLFPLKLSPVFEIFEPSTLNYLMIIASYLLLISLIVITYKKNKLIFGLILVIYVALLPLLTPFNIAVNLAERYYYLSGAFFVILLSLLIFRLSEKTKEKNTIFLITAILLFTYSSRTFIRTFDWRNDKTLWSSARETTANNYRIYNELGNVFYREDNLREALKNYQKAMEIRPVYPIVYHNTGLTFLKANQIQNAKAYFEKSISQDPLLHEGYFRLGQIAQIEGDFDLSKKYFEKALSIKADYSPALDALNKL